MGYPGRIPHMKCAFRHLRAWVEAALRADALSKGSQMPGERGPGSGGDVPLEGGDWEKCLTSTSDYITRRV